MSYDVVTISQIKIATVVYISLSFGRTLYAQIIKYIVQKLVYPNGHC